MINISLLPDKPIWAQVSLTPTTVTRIGEIVLLPNEIKTLDEVFDSRPPWQSFIVANDWDINSGSYISPTNKRDETVISLVSSVWDIDKVVNLSDQEFMLSLIQQNDNNGYQAAVNSGCFLNGTRISDNEIFLDFKVEKCEMLYNR